VWEEVVVEVDVQRNRCAQDRVRLHAFQFGKARMTSPLPDWEVFNLEFRHSGRPASDVLQDHSE
jgi:hypothetical protein